MNNIPCIYLFIYRIFKSKSNGRIFISYACIREILRRRLHKIPRVLHYQILKEMQNYKLIRKIGWNEKYNRPFKTKNIQYELTGKDIDKKLNQFNLPI